MDDDQRKRHRFGGAVHGACIHVPGRLTLVALVRAGARFERGNRVERPEVTAA